MKPIIPEIKLKFGLLGSYILEFFLNLSKEDIFIIYSLLFSDLSFLRMDFEYEINKNIIYLYYIFQGISDGIIGLLMKLFRWKFYSTEI
jgi:hypothetical protein